MLKVREETKLREHAGNYCRRVVEHFLPHFPLALSQKHMHTHTYTYTHKHTHTHMHTYTLQLVAVILVAAGGSP